MKKKIIIIAVAVILAIGAVVGGILIAKNIREKDPGSYSDSVTQSIRIPGFTEIEVEKETENVSIFLENPEGNPCTFVYEIALKETGEILYTSPSLAPGSSITEAKLACALPEGKYPVVISVKTASVSDGKAMNGGTFDTVIIAK